MDRKIGGGGVLVYFAAFVLLNSPAACLTHAQLVQEHLKKKFELEVSLGELHTGVS